MHRPGPTFWTDSLLYFDPEESWKAPSLRIIAYRALDKEGESARSAGSRVKYHLNGVDRSWLRINGVFDDMSDTAGIMAVKDFVEKRCDIVELTPHAFPFRRSGME
ncbi:hypothetical protein IAR50_001062 [Cryptococcus sp. DSM 104548]